MDSASYDVIVIGGGHAGAEAAWAAAHLGARTALLTHARAAIGRPSCNPAVGGIGKGQIVREVDALGGLMGRVTDEAGIQFRMLNRSKGPAVWAPRAQIDDRHYAAVLLRYLETCPDLTIIEAGVDAIEGDAIPSSANLPLPPDEEAEGGSNRTLDPQSSLRPLRRVTGVRLADGRVLRAGAIVVAAGTFLRGLMHTGDERTPGGRVGEAAADNLSASLRALGLYLSRLKTGTPPRVAADSVDFSRLTAQSGDNPPVPFSFMTDRIEQEQVCCWHAATTPRMHELIRANLHRAPLFTGQIASTGPRYCPSIETKVVRFPDKTSHQLFLEPEGRGSDRIYINGISTSLPRDVQARLVAMIPGLERARIVQWGYAVEYDFVPPEQIDATLMTKRVAGLFLAGQINGTSGYEEAAGQGIVAGINAARFVARRDPLVLGRDEAYIGVMIDDLVTRGVTEPYRMFTSRAEHRLHLRYDNADARLTPIGRRLGLVDDARWRRFEAQQRLLDTLWSIIDARRPRGTTLREQLQRLEVDESRLLAATPELAAFRAHPDTWARAVVAVRYDGYIRRQERVIEAFRKNEALLIPSGFAFERVPHLRQEAVERWSVVRPRNVGQAARVSGIHPTDVEMLLVYLSANKAR